MTIDMNSTHAATNSYCFLSFDSNRDMVETVLVARQEWIMNIRNIYQRKYIESWILEIFCYLMYLV